MRTEKLAQQLGREKTRAGRLLERDAHVLNSRGKRLDPTNIGDALATRELMQSLREEGLAMGGPSGFTAKDRSEFLMRLDNLVHEVRRKVGAEK